MKLGILGLTLLIGSMVSAGCTGEKADGERADGENASTVSDSSQKNAEKQSLGEVDTENETVDTSDGDTNGGIELDCATGGAAMCQAWSDAENACVTNVLDGSDFSAECLTYFPTTDFLSCGFSNAVVACMNDFGCGEGSIFEDCVFQALIAIEPAGWDVQQIQNMLDGTFDADSDWKVSFGGADNTCLVKYTECTDADEDSMFFDDICITAAALSTAAKSQVPACLELDCEEIGDCMYELGAFDY